MTANPNSSTPPYRARNHYPAAALVTCMVFSVLELAAPLAAGAGRASMEGPVGYFVQLTASQLVPAPSLMGTSGERMEMAYNLLLTTKALLVVALTALMWGCSKLARTSGQHRGVTVLLSIQFALTLALGSDAFNLVLAAQLAALLPLRAGLVWLAMIVLCDTGADAWLLTRDPRMLNGMSTAKVLAFVAVEHGILLLGFAFAWLLRQELQVRLRLAASNAQLRATQSLLGDTVRASERMRIARDLHDAVGHHLSALNLHLDLACRQSGERPMAALGTSRELAQTLLAEVRSVVSAERQEQDIQISQALQLLCAGIPTPSIRLEVGDGVDGCAPVAAHALLCCVQEAITNAIRHAGAGRMSIQIQRVGGDVVAQIADNGNGGHGAAEGNGLSGMRERLAALGGTLRAGGQPRQGFQLEFSLPLAGARP